MENSDEIWRPIPGWEGIYEASSGGRIRSLDRILMVAQKGTTSPRRKRGKVLKPTLTNNGYLHVYLTDAARREQHSVHCLVAATFLGKRPTGAFVCHNNGNKTDNRLGNIRYDKPASNTADMRAHGTKIFGDRHARSKLSDADVFKVRDLHSRGVPAKELAERFQCTRTNIYMIVNGKTRILSTPFKRSGEEVRAENDGLHPPEIR